MWPDNRFEVFLDRTSINSGSLLSDVQPPVNPPAEIDDPDDKKPEDWDEREKIPDPDAEKPDDWNEDAPASIPDPNAKVFFYCVIVLLTRKGSLGAELKPFNFATFIALVIRIVNVVSRLRVEHVPRTTAKH